MSNETTGREPTNETNPDPGRSPDALKPLSPEEYELLKEEARRSQPIDGHREAAGDEDARFPPSHPSLYGPGNPADSLA